MDRAAETVIKGGVVLFPTAGLYGLAVDAMNEDAVRRLYRIKQRSPSNPILLLVNDREALGRITASIPHAAAKIMERYWPGRITIVFDADPSVSTAITAGTGKVGARIPAHKVARALAKRLDAPITGTSANLSGNAGCSTIADISPDLLREADLILDAGPLRGGPGSTVIDVTVVPPVILREGSVPAADIFACLRG